MGAIVSSSKCWREEHVNNNLDRGRVNVVLDVVAGDGVCHGVDVADVSGVRHCRVAC